MADISSTNPTDWGAAEIARRIARREISVTEVVQAHVERIEEVDGRINAVILPRFEWALHEAKAADELLAKGTAGQASTGSLGLFGVPFTVKACFATAGQPATVGNTPGAVSDRDALLVKRLKSAGAILVGKTNIPQMMCWHESDNPVYGRTNNPWDLGRTPGGSTGGEAAIVAARGSPLGLGNDLGGSIRVPCHFCGIHGLKPTSFRLPREGSITTLRGLDSIVTQPGPMVRHVEDLWLAMRVMGDNSDGYVAGDVTPCSLPDPAKVDVSRLKIAVLTYDGLFPASTGIQRAVREAAAALRKRGATVVELDEDSIHDLIGHGEFLDTYCSMLGSDGGADARRMTRGIKLDWRVARLMWIAGLRMPTRMAVARGLRLAGQKWMARMVTLVRPMSADAARQLAHARQRYIRSVLDKLAAERIDALLMPPHALPAPQHVKAFDLVAAAGYAILFNLLGFPAGVVSISRIRPGEDHGRRAGRDQVERQSVAVDRGSVGLPIGVQVVGLPWREDVVLSTMLALEQAFISAPDYPNRTRVPSVAREEKAATMPK
ncbi:MAG: amidase [Planctomycetaceae bacterium]|nr:amidase [Planctomycetaceae bacterium]